MEAAQIRSTLPIGLDGRMLGDGGTGVATYARSLRDALALISPEPLILSARAKPSVVPAWLAATRGRQTIGQMRNDLGEKELQGIDPFRRAHIHFGYRRQLYRLRCPALSSGIMHWSYPVPILMEGWINIYTVHDMIPVDQPDLTPINSQRHLAVLRAIAAHADRILTVSESARQSILAGLGCPEALVTNCGQPVDVAATRVRTLDDALPGGLVQGDYLLIVGSIEPRKNIAAMVAAYRAGNFAIPLVVAGPDGWRAKDINKEIAQVPSVIRLPYLSRADLLALIAGARALLFASLAEGFGLPMIEAMALGTPVLTSDRGALAEIAGGAALLADPTNPIALEHAIKRIADDHGLRSQLSALGKARAAGFSLTSFADRIRTVYQDAIQTRRW